jgi:hypothetical protein
MSVGECCYCFTARRDGKERRHLSAVPVAGAAKEGDIRNRYIEEVRWKLLLLGPVTGSPLALRTIWPRPTKVQEALDELAECGPQLGRPLVDHIHDSKIHNLKELRPRVPGTAEVRLLFVFDPDRQAIALVAGDKAGRWGAWYAESIPLAEEQYAAYQRGSR